MRESQADLASDVPGEPRGGAASEVLVELAAGKGPLHARLTAALRGAIRGGRLAAGSALPPSRRLAADLGCSRWVVTHAYAQLVAEGYLEGRTGSATRVRRIDALARRAAAAPAERPVRFDLAPGLPDLRHFPRRRWVEAIRSAAGAAPFTDLAYPDPGGHPRLRAVLAEYLGRVRGADPGDVTVCRSVTDGVARACRGLRAAGVAAVAVEDPGWPALREAAEDAGLRTVPIPVDGEGLRVEQLAERRDVRAAIVAPAHQFPTGAVLSPARRAALLEWARRADGVVIEDDYDAEFRYDRRPVGAVQGTDPGRVILFGSLSKTLSPALRIGWAVTPPRWTAAMRAGDPPPALDQLAFAALLESEAYGRHLRAARLRYRARRDALVGAIAERLPECRVSGVAAGLHLMLALEPGAEAGAVAARAAGRGVRVADLDRYRVEGRGAEPGLVLGYGNLADGSVEGAVAELAAAYHPMSPWRPPTRRSTGSAS